MLNKDTRDMLQSLTTITDKFKLQNKTTIMDAFNQLIVSIDFEKLGENFTEPIYIGEMPQLLGAIGLIDDPVITKNKNIINIKNDISTIKYLCADEKSIPDVKYKIIESTKNVKSSLEFTLTTDIIELIKKGAGVFKTLNTIFINKADDKLVLSLGINQSFNAAHNEFDISINKFNDIQNQNFEIKIPVQSFLRIPQAEYNFEVKYNTSKKSYRVYLNNALIEVVMSTIN